MKEKNKKTDKSLEKETKITKNDYEDSNDKKKIIVVSLILAILICSFAFIRSFDKDEKKEVKNKEKVVEKDDVTDKTTDLDDKELVSVNEGSSVITAAWHNLDDINTEIEAGSGYALPNVTYTDKDINIVAVITYEYRGNSNEEYVVVPSFDTSKIGEYFITYTLTYPNGNKEYKTVKVVIKDTTAPIITNINDNAYYASDIIPSIVEYSSYTMMLNGLEYDGSVISDGNYQLVVTDKNGLETTVNFVIDTVAPAISGVGDLEYYNTTITPVAEDLNLTDVYVEMNGAQVAFVNGLTSFNLDGEYTIVAIDAAGNMMTYSFVIDTVPAIVNVTYTPEGDELVTTSVLVTISSDKILQELDTWVLSEDKLTLTKEYTENIDTTVTIKDLAGNETEVEVIVNKINHSLEFTPDLKIENLVANKVKATITSLEQLTITNTDWIETILEDGTYSYEKIYTASTVEIVEYTSISGEGTIEVEIDIVFDDLFVTYSETEITEEDVTAYVTLDEEAITIEEEWLLDDTYTEGFRYYKTYSENVEYELATFETASNIYVATITIENIERP